MNKAKYKGCHINKADGKKHLEYEYRGERYWVIADWNAEPLSWQHKSWQSVIDEQIENRERIHKLVESGKVKMFELSDLDLLDW